MKRLLKIFVSSIFSGVLISIGGLAYLSMKNISVFLGSFLFSLGLLSIVCFKLYLFTGKIGYVFDNKISYLGDLVVCWLGNLVGALCIGYSMRCTRLELVDVCKEISMAKLNDNVFSVFILSILCGMMIYIAVEIQKKEILNCFKLIGLILPVMVFIVSGFEHCVANMFYFSYSNVWSVNAILYILLMTLGNSIGSIVLWLMNKFIGEI